MIGDVRQHMPQIGFGIETVELGRPDEGVEDGGTFASAIRAREEIVAATDGNPTQGPFGCGVMDSTNGRARALRTRRRSSRERPLISFSIA
jgi:hypothetical protein